MIEWDNRPEYGRVVLLRDGVPCHRAWVQQSAISCKYVAAYTPVVATTGQSKWSIQPNSTVTKDFSHLVDAQDWLIQKMVEEKMT
jgi:hypothetical protein